MKKKDRSVKLNNVPRWLYLRLRSKYKQTDLLRERFNLLKAAAGGRTVWLDHWGSSFNARGESILVAEPYNFSWETAVDVNSFAIALNLNWHVSSNAT